MTTKRKEALRVIVREVLEALDELQEEEMEEASTSAGVAGYNSKYAFGKKKKDESDVEPEDYEFVDDLQEAIELAENRWLDLKRDETRNNNRKLADVTSNVRKEMKDINKRMDWCCRIKDNNGISRDQYHERTKRNLNKIQNEADKLRRTLKNFVM